MQQRNPFESAARTRKTAALVKQIDIWAMKVGIDPLGDAVRFAELLESLTDVEWLGLAMLADVRPPSHETRRMVVATISERGKTLPAPASVEVTS